MKPYSFISHSYIGKMSDCSMAGFSAQGLRDWNPGVDQAGLSSGRSGEASASDLIRVVGRIQCLSAIELISCFLASN